METAKRVREKHADPEMKGRRQSDIQVRQHDTVLRNTRQAVVRTMYFVE